jgi:hypothetical protein
VNFQDWAGSPGEPGLVLDLRVPGALDHLVSRYADARPAVMSEVLAQVYRLGGQTALVEYRYLDPDYRNEHSRFYSSTFRRYPSVAHRLHFWSEPPPAELDDPRLPARFLPDSYLGYSVIRPVPGAPVGRTMLRPQDTLREYIGCSTADEANLFGTRLDVTAAPFMAQDAQLSVCAHATLWITAYYHHLEYHSPRRLPGDISDAVPSAFGMGRPTPSLGLTINQLIEAARVIGLPCLVYPVATATESVYALACRYLNSGMPVIIAGGGHAFTLVGYQPYRAPDGLKRTRFIRQDDEVGPYQEVENADLDDYAPWQYLIVPLPQKVYVSGEKAEELGIQRLRETLGASGSAEDLALLERIKVGEVRFRTSVVRSKTFKRHLIDRGMETSTATIDQRMGMSRWIWVVEATDAVERDAGRASVIAEAVIDATDHLRDMHVLAWRIPRTLYRWVPDEDDYEFYRNLADSPLLPCLAKVSQRVV